MDIYETLHQDHQEVIELMGQIAVAGKDLALFRRLAGVLDRHMRAEEHTFYRALSRSGQGAEEVLFGLEQHRLIRRLGTSLLRGPQGGARWSAKFRLYRQIVEDHVEREESTLFELGRTALQPAAGAALATRFQTEKVTRGGAEAA